MFSLNVPDTTHLIIAAIASCAIAGIASAVRALSLSGAIAAICVGFVIFGWGGYPGATALLLFFLTSSALSRWGKRQKAALTAYEKGDQRDAGQVIANGGVAVICMAWIAIEPMSVTPVAALLGAIATANADTWATEIGTVLGPKGKKKPIVLATLYDGEPGQSGAVSWQGTAAALAGAALIALTAPLWTVATLPGTLIGVTIGGLAGSLFDSFLGGAVQVQYRDGVTGELTERETDANGRENPIERGQTWINNDAVNFFATAVREGQRRK
ncbi:MAG: DUF92 domain-containing protein [Fibrella sp.]|nr:DUF92 domain-containing protein [Armatimonadota bacterium]